MHRKNCLITGANSGIGKAAALQLAQLGFHVLVGSRSIERGMSAVAEVKAMAKSDYVELVQIDLSSRDSIREASQFIKSKFHKLDVLVHNAAEFDVSRKKPALTPEGIESVWATNHLGPVLLTHQLMDLLQQSDQGRIVTVASKGLVLHPGLTINLEDPEFKRGGYSVPGAYYQSKLAQVMYTLWLSDKLTGTRVTANCIRVTNVQIDISRYPHLTRWMKFMYSIKRRFSITPEQMAMTYVHLAASPQLNTTTGKYFDEKNRIVNPSRYSQNKANIDQLMRLTHQYLPEIALEVNP
ncbi:MAG: SDR family NAD(P)-dependent oxidoreductase [Cyclobacteriaceae bacterium]|nr:SDR family NAD(P)-dependent oxidoreductase [Cyclobacteriaceae bacterium]